MLSRLLSQMFASVGRGRRGSSSGANLLLPTADAVTNGQAGKANEKIDDDPVKLIKS